MISFGNKMALEHGFPIIKLGEAMRNGAEGGRAGQINFNGVSVLKKERLNKIGKKVSNEITSKFHQQF